MSVSSIGAKSTLRVKTLVDMRAQLDDLQRQLGTGKKANTYAGLGLDRGLTVSLRSQLSALDGYGGAIDVTSVRLKVAQTALTNFDTSIHTVKTSTLNSNFVIDQTGQTEDQKTAAGQLDQMLNLLNTRVGDSFIFSGKSPDTPAVESLDHILNGDVGRAGFKQIMAERRQADLGATGLGRLVIPAPSASPATLIGTGATLSPDAAAVMTGATNLASLSSAGGTLEINGINIAIGAGANATAVLAAINAPATVAQTGVTASLNATNQLVLTSVDAATAIAVGAGSTAGLLTELGLSVATANPTNLLTQGAVTGGQTLTVTIGANPTLTVTFGNGVGQVQTLAQLNAALGTLVGGAATVNPANGNISVTAANTTDTISIGGTATAANFGLATTTASPASGTRVSVSEDFAGSPFGFKLASVASTLAGATVAGPSGAPPGISIDLGATNPNNGDTIAFTFQLPDGSSQNLTMTATTASPPGKDQFTIGATVNATAANLQAALTASVGTLAQTSLVAASAMAAANDFFNIDAANPPRRVNGPPFDSATSLIAGTSANTVTWYTGEAGGSPARDAAIARVDQSISVSYGMRGNEQGLRWGIQNVAVFAAMSFTASDPNGRARYDEMRSRVSVKLDFPQGTQKVTDIAAEIAGAQISIEAARNRHTQTKAALTDLLQTAEGVPMEEVSAQILMLQTRLQASLQTTSLLAKTTLVNFL